MNLLLPDEASRGLAWVSSPDAKGSEVNAWSLLSTA